MSRSFKKNPVVTDSSLAKYGKKFANDRVKAVSKKAKEDDSLPQNGDYKKLYPSWNIRDYKIRYTLEEHMKYYDEHQNDESFLKQYPNKKVWERAWITEFKSK